MTLRQMQYFLAVVDEGSFTRAAERLFVSQPALSHQVKALEQSLGGALLERRPQAVHLTPLGRPSPPHAAAAVRAAEDAQRAARAVGQLEAGGAGLPAPPPPPPRRGAARAPPPGA